MEKDISIVSGGDGVGRRMTFLDMIAEYAIVIPVIQRDYAQGRTSERVTDIRKSFVGDLFSYLGDSQPNSHELDVIYGSAQGGEFVPLDGQQRLTTLFLLHLYVAGMNDTVSFDALRDKLKGRFIYKTRKSSTLFCAHILEGNVFQEFKHLRDAALKQIEEERENNPKAEPDVHVPKLSEVIKNQGWFFNVWCQDPTVSGMLEMLDSLDAGSKGMKIEEAYQRLFVDLDPNPPITFLMLPLDGYSRQDDLYIKMNARGVHLTDFENFKAKFEDFLEQIQYQDRKIVKEKFDRNWAEYLWQYRGGADNTDAVMESILRFVISCSFRSDKPEKEVQNTMDYLLERNNKTMRFVFSRYCDLSVFHKRGDLSVNPSQVKNETYIVDNVINFFDLICHVTASPFLDSIFGVKETAERLFLEHSSAEYSERLRLYAYMKYVSGHKSAVDDADLCQWMRLVKNLDNATPINSSYDFNKACQSVDDLLRLMGQTHVLEWLSKQTNPNLISWFRSYQFQEECLKARILLWTGDADLEQKVKELVDRCEADGYMTGQLGFLLLFSGFYTPPMNTVAEFRSRYENMDFYARKAMAFFSLFYEEKRSPILSEHLFERALLTKGFYLKEASASRWNFCNVYSDRDYSWKSMLIYDPAQPTLNNESLRCFKAVLDEIGVATMEQDLRRIISTAAIVDSPRAVLWNNPALIEYCSQGFVTIYKDEQSNPIGMVLLGQSKMSHYHSELWSRDLYERLKSSKPFLGYSEVKREDDDSPVYFCFEESGRQYRFNISHWKDGWYFEIANADGLDDTPVPQNVKDLFKGIDVTKGGESILDEALSVQGINVIKN